MKCVKRLTDGVVSRMSDNQARAIVQNYPTSFEYAPKKEWKDQAKTVAERVKFYMPFSYTATKGGL